MIAYRRVRIVGDSQECGLIVWLASMCIGRRRPCLHKPALTVRESFLPEMHRWSPTNSLLGGKDDGVTSIYRGPVNHPRPSRVLCIFGNMQINLLTSSFPARHHTLYECSSHFLPATFQLGESLGARLLCLFASVLSQEACVGREAPTSRSVSHRSYPRVEIGHFSQRQLFLLCLSAESCYGTYRGQV